LLDRDNSQHTRLPVLQSPHQPLHTFNDGHLSTNTIGFTKIISTITSFSSTC
jgi:hypothetical protein